jgi:GntP family gluconate:H+ symporter
LSAALVKPIANSQPGTNLNLLVLALEAGSLISSLASDGGFRLVKSCLNMWVPEPLKSWTLLEAVLSLVSFGCVMLLDALLR